MEGSISTPSQETGTPSPTEEQDVAEEPDQRNNPDRALTGYACPDEGAVSAAAGIDYSYTRTWNGSEEVEPSGALTPGGFITCNYFYSGDDFHGLSVMFRDTKEEEATGTWERALEGISPDGLVDPDGVVSYWDESENIQSYTQASGSTDYCRAQILAPPAGGIYVEAERSFDPTDPEFSTNDPCPWLREIVKMAHTASP